MRCDSDDPDHRSVTGPQPCHSRQAPEKGWNVVGTVRAGADGLRCTTWRTASRVAWKSRSGTSMSRPCRSPPDRRGRLRYPGDGREARARCAAPGPPQLNHDWMTDPTASVCSGACLALVLTRVATCSSSSPISTAQRALRVSMVRLDSAICSAVADGSRLTVSAAHWSWCWCAGRAARRSRSSAGSMPLRNVSMIAARSRERRYVFVECSFRRLIRHPGLLSGLSRPCGLGASYVLISLRRDSGTGNVRSVQWC